MPKYVAKDGRGKVLSCRVRKKGIDILEVMAPICRADAMRAGLYLLYEEFRKGRLNGDQIMKMSRKVKD